MKNYNENQLIERMKETDKFRLFRENAPLAPVKKPFKETDKSRLFEENTPIVTDKKSSSSITKSSQSKQGGDLKERLRKLKEIYDEGIIEKEDYKKKVDELMKQL